MCEGSWDCVGWGGRVISFFVTYLGGGSEKISGETGGGGGES